MFGSALRRDRVRIPLWLIGILAFTLYCTRALMFAVPKESDLTAMASLMRGAAGVVLVGPGYGFEHPTYQSVFVGGYGFYVMLLAAYMSILLAVRHTRQEEETGVQELTQALPVGRYAGLTVAVAVLCVANIGATLLVWGSLSLVFDTGSSLLFAAGVGLIGLVSGAATLTCAQWVERSRTGPSVSRCASSEPV